MKAIWLLLALPISLAVRPLDQVNPQDFLPPPSADEPVLSQKTLQSWAARVSLSSRYGPHPRGVRTRFCELQSNGFYISFGANRKTTLLIDYRVYSKQDREFVAVPFDTLKGLLIDGRLLTSSLNIKPLTPADNDPSGKTMSTTEASNSFSDGDQVYSDVQLLEAMIRGKHATLVFPGESYAVDLTALRQLYAFCVKSGVAAPHLRG